MTQAPAVEVTVPAAPAFVPLLRKAAASTCPTALASRVDDVRLAVSEACTLLLQLHAPATRFVLGVTAGEDDLTVVLRTDAAEADVPPSGLDESWSWKLLRSTADRTSYGSTVDGPTIEMRFTAAGGPAAATSG